MNRVLIVDDEPALRTALSVTLRAAGYDVTCAADAREALRLAGETVPDVVLVDLGLPDRDGTHVIRRLRAWTDAPILVVSGRTGSRDVVGALDAGADGYVTKPFSVDELLARLRAARRRSPDGVPSPTRYVGRHVLDLAERTITGADDCGSDPPRLTPTEWALLEALLHEPHRLVPAADLATAVWGDASRGSLDSLRTHLVALRRKLEPDPMRPRHLVTEPGLGYRYEP